RKLHLTDSGQAVYQRGGAIVGEFRKREAGLEDISAVRKGVLRLGIPPMVGRQIAGLIRHFRHAYPGIELRIS
ncbi:LysR family transcriptional regulator, partial [Vibrio cholerae O1]|nr:LysR family transcriptional regulator [Vibrio cholerae O1]